MYVIMHSVKKAVSVAIASGKSANRCDVFKRVSTLWLIFPINTIEAEAFFSSFPLAKEPEWKKKLLRERGCNVIEYKDDYSKSVEKGRRLCEIDEKCYFVDDANSVDLFLGYPVAVLRLKRQLEELGVSIDEIHLCLPCGVGGAPGGITFGLKHIYGDNVYCYFVEPTHAPCLSIALITKKYEFHISQYGITCITKADGLAVGSPSKLVAPIT